MTQEDDTPVWIRGVPGRGKEVIAMFKEFFNGKEINQAEWESK